MAQIDSAEFEALWESAKSQQVVRKLDTKPIQVDLFLSGIVNQYLAMAERYRDKGSISHIDYDALADAVNSLKTVLARIDDSELVADAMSQIAGGMKKTP